ncbi:hypothetical protein ACU686_42815 [Yinghuangia aomiensis]
MASTPVSLFLCGDVMLGRGVDQAPPHPGIRTARGVRRRCARGHCARPKPSTGPCRGRWSTRGRGGSPGGARRRAARRADRESRDERDLGRRLRPYKAVHYRMNPGNLRRPWPPSVPTPACSPTTTCWTSAVPGRWRRWTCCTARACAR